MKSFKLHITLVLLAVVAVATSSCDLFKQRSRVYGGPAVVEFYPQSSTVSEGSSLSVKVQLIGEQRNSDTSINFAVVDSNTTAESGTYSIPTSSPVTIPANSSSTSIDINAGDNPNMGSGEHRTLTLVLNGNDQVNGAENLKYFTLRIEGN